MLARAMNVGRDEDEGFQNAGNYKKQQMKAMEKTRFSWIMEMILMIIQYRDIVNCFLFRNMAESEKKGKTGN